MVVGLGLTFDFTSLVMFSFKVPSTAVSLAAIVLLSWPVTGSRLLEMSGRDKGKGDSGSPEHFGFSLAGQWEGAMAPRITSSLVIVLRGVKNPPSSTAALPTYCLCG